MAQARVISDGQPVPVDAQPRLEPVAEHAAATCRIYFSTRDERNRSSIGWLEFDCAARSRFCASPRSLSSRRGRRRLNDSGASMGAWWWRRTARATCTTSAGTSA